jgi:SulP family sulfate permease
VLVNRYGLEGLWVAGLLSGALLTVIGLLRLGRFIAFIPAPVTTGFTSGIAWIIAIGQIDNLLGVRVPRGELPVAGLEFLQESAALKLLGYFQHVFTPDWRALLVGGVVIALMLLWPKAWNARFPASLLGIVVATALALLTGWDTPAIGAIPQTLLLDERLSVAAIPWANWQEFIAPALTITALGAVESLLCGAVASNMTGVRLAANVELIAQGVGNLLIPFFGGVPATAAIARTSVGIKSGGQTRLTSVVHALALLASMFVLAPVMARIPLAALAGVLIVTAWRMNEWEAIGYIFKHRLKTAMFTFAITLLATVVLDLTQAILIGAFLSGAVFLNQLANMNITVQGVDREKLRLRGVEVRGSVEHVRVAYLTGPLFFAATGHFNEAFARLDGVRTLILSMRGVPLIDTSGLQALLTLVEKLRQQGGTLMLAGVHEPVRQMLERGGLVEEIGADNFFWSAEQAISEAARRISQNS